MDRWTYTAKYRHRKARSDTVAHRLWMKKHFQNGHAVIAMTITMHADLSLLSNLREYPVSVSAGASAGLLAKRPTSCHGAVAMTTGEILWPFTF